MYTDIKNVCVRIRTLTSSLCIFHFFSTFSFKQLMSNAWCCRSAAESIALVQFLPATEFYKNLDLNPVFVAKTLSLFCYCVPVGSNFDFAHIPD